MKLPDAKKRKKMQLSCCVGDRFSSCSKKLYTRFTRLYYVYNIYIYINIICTVYYNMSIVFDYNMKGIDIFLGIERF